MRAAGVWNSTGQSEMRRMFAAATGVGMQIDERAVGEVTILDLKGKITLNEGDEVLKDRSTPSCRARRRFS